LCYCINYRRIVDSPRSNPAQQRGISGTDLSPRDRMTRHHPSRPLPLTPFIVCELMHSRAHALTLDAYRMNNYQISTAPAISGPDHCFCPTVIKIMLLYSQMRGARDFWSQFQRRHRLHTPFFTPRAQQRGDSKFIMSPAGRNLLRFGALPFMQKHAAPVKHGRELKTFSINIFLTASHECATTVPMLIN
jgi:hypothetical protein